MKAKINTRSWLYLLLFCFFIGGCASPTIKAPSTDSYAKQKKQQEQAEKAYESLEKAVSE